MAYTKISQRAARVVTEWCRVATPCLVLPLAPHLSLTIPCQLTPPPSPPPLLATRSVIVTRLLNYRITHQSRVSMLIGQGNSRNLTPLNWGRTQANLAAIIITKYNNLHVSLVIIILEIFILPTMSRPRPLGFYGSTHHLGNKTSRYFIVWVFRLLIYKKIIMISCNIL